MEKSEEDSSDLDDLSWSFKKIKQPVMPCHNIKDHISEKNTKCKVQTTTEKYHKFEELKKKYEDIKIHTTRRIQIAEKRRSKKLVKKALRDPYIRELVQKNPHMPDCEQSTKEKEVNEWKEVRPFLTINSHLQGPVSHGDVGPKTEMEYIIEDALKKGDFEKAELLSDTLANKEFAGKICKAFSAKRCHEQLERQKAVEKAQQMKKIRWTFEAKQKWEMKGNM